MASFSRCFGLSNSITDRDTSAIQNEAKLDPLHPDRRLETACRTHNIPLMSLTQHFRKFGWDRSYREESHQYFFGGTGHFNERGSRMAAEQLSK
jgi:hypothetical protein